MNGCVGAMTECAVSGCDREWVRVSVLITSGCDRVIIGRVSECACLSKYKHWVSEIVSESVSQ